jgi:hypothetical protein
MVRTDPMFHMAGMPNASNLVTIPPSKKGGLLSTVACKRLPEFIQEVIWMVQYCSLLHVAYIVIHCLLIGQSLARTRLSVRLQ